jgi:Domain of unknown function (DUF6924)
MSLPMPPDFHALVVRTDFTDDGAWVAVYDLIESFDCEGYRPTLLRLEDPAFDGATVKDLLRGSGPDHAFVVDSRTIADPEHPVLVVDLDPEYGQPGRSFRTIPAEVCAIDANLGISNMDFEEFAQSVGADNVFRGFPE